MQSTINSNRYIPPAMNGHFDYIDNANCEIFYTDSDKNSGNKFYAIAYRGKGAKPAWHYSFKSKERMMEYIEKYVEERKMLENFDKERKAKKKEANASVTVKVGDMFVYSWGYDQTNTEFYQVTEVKNRTAKLHRIGSKVVKGSEGFMCASLTPVKDNFITTNYGDDVITKRIQASYDGKPYFSMEFGGLHPTTEDTASYSSWYA